MIGCALIASGRWPYDGGMSLARLFRVSLMIAACTSVAVADDGHKRREAPEGTPALGPVLPPALTPPQDAMPWAKGVSDDQKAAAQRALGEGNNQFVQNNFREALVAYETAVAAWDHPAIRFNMVRTLIALDRPLEASKSLEKALAYGQGPLEDQMYTEALNYRRLIAGQIAEVEVACNQPGVKVKLDGQNLVECPGTVTKKATPGMHVLVGSKPAYLTHSQDVMLLGGKKQQIVVQLVTIQKATVYRTRW